MQNSRAQARLGRWGHTPLPSAGLAAWTRVCPGARLEQGEGPSLYQGPRREGREVWGGEAGKNTDQSALIQDLGLDMRKERRTSGAPEREVRE